jgi:exopolyphosphatase/guanosine-5'-triphosphate,3'-diphosphate pyrophosphatase
MRDLTKAVIDVGTNSIKLCVARLERGQLFVLADIVSVTRLGEGTAETGLLAPEAMERSKGALYEMADTALRLGADEIISVGTQALRAARNRGEFIAAVESECGFKIMVISGEEEAELSFRAVRSLAAGKTPGGALVFDVGGGSSETVFGRGSLLERRLSIPTGALSLYKKFFAAPDGVVSGGVIEEAGRYVRSVAAQSGLEGSLGFGASPSCFGVGGAVTALASVFLGQALRGVSGAVLSMAEIDRQIEMYASTDIASRRKIRGLPPDRVDIVLPGACIVKSLMEITARSEMIVCGRGIRHALLEETLNHSAFSLYDKRRESQRL